MSRQVIVGGMSIVAWAVAIAAGGEKMGSQRVADLVANMTLAEKESLLSGIGWGEDDFDPAPGYYVGNTPSIPRLNIPAINMQDAGQGFRTTDRRMVGEVTSWSVGLGLASTWDEGLVGEWATAVAAEYRAKGANMVLGPGLNTHRVARGGRNAEYLSGEEPWLGAALVGAYVRGFQANGVMAVAKHFGLNSQETDRDYVNAIVPDARALFEVYHVPFAAAASAGAAAFMCSYNLLNGSHACSSGQLLGRDLKGSMGYQGFVMSDWWAAHNTSAAQGLDMEMPGNAPPGKDGPFLSPSALAAAGLTTTPTDVIDGMVTRILGSMEATGLLEGGAFYPPACDPTGDSHDCDSFLYDVNATSDAHAALALRIATESVTLLKNDNATLPFKASAPSSSSASSPLTIAVVGSACVAPNHINAMLAKWDLGNYYVIGGSGRVIPASVTNIADGIKARAAALTAAGSSVEVLLVPRDDPAAAAAAMVQNDGGANTVVVACGGAASTEGQDRSTLSLDQEAFLVETSQAARAARGGAGVPLVAVMLSPGPVLTPFRDDASAVVNIFLGGAATGEAVAAVLFGDATPYAKSPITFPASEVYTVPPCVYNDTNGAGFDCMYAEGLFVGYKGLDAGQLPVAFPFGHGLGFNAFSYAWMSPPSSISSSSGSVSFSVALECVPSGTSTGGEDVEIMQVYISYPEEAQEPPRNMRAFRKVTVPCSVGGASPVVVDVELDASAFHVWSNDAWSFVPGPSGTYTIAVGASSRDIRLEATVDL